MYNSYMQHVALLLRNEVIRGSGPPFFEWTLNIVARGLYMRRFDHYRAFRMLIAREIYSMQRDEAPFKNLNDD